jgi:hypothetical protein
MIIITGSGRSGTSAVARLIHEAGISVGRELIAADESNPEGYFEERPVVALNDFILKDAGMDAWFSVATRAELLAAARARGDEMRALAAEATPAWKDPRFCWMLEAWMEVLPTRPRVVVCLRSPLEVVASTLKYYGQVSDEARRHVEHRWRSEYERLLEIIDEFGLEATCIEFSDLHRRTKHAAAMLSRFVGRELDASAVRQDLRHHRARVPARLRETYERVKQLGVGGGATETQRHRGTEGLATRD